MTAEWTRITTSELCVAGGCSPGTLSRWVKRGLLPPCTKVGGPSGGMSGFYPHESLEIVKSIVKLRAMGYSLDEVKVELDKEAKTRSKNAKQRR